MSRQINTHPHTVGDVSHSEAEIRALVVSQRKVLRSLAKATPERLAAIYAGS